MSKFDLLHCLIVSQYQLDRFCGSKDGALWAEIAQILHFSPHWLNKGWQRSQY